MDAIYWLLLFVCAAGGLWFGAWLGGIGER